MKLFPLMAGVSALSLFGISQLAPRVFNQTGTQTPQRERVAQATRTQLPTATGRPTVGWEATAQAAQQEADHAQATADAAMIIQAQITAEHDRMVLSAAELTAEYERREYQVYAWTATAEMTAVPLTGTAQAQADAFVAGHMTQVSANMTQVAEAPTVAIAMERSKIMAELERPRQVAEIVALGGAGIGIPLVLAVGLVVVLSRKRGQAGALEDAELVEDEIAPTDWRVLIQRENGPGMTSTSIQDIPFEKVTPEQLRDIANGLKLNVPFARKYWVGKDNSLSRGNWDWLCDWLVENGLARWVDEGNHTRGIILLPDGEQYFERFATV